MPEEGLLDDHDRQPYGLDLRNRWAQLSVHVHWNLESKLESVLCLLHYVRVLHLLHPSDRRRHDAVHPLQRHLQQVNVPRLGRSCALLHVRRLLLDLLFLDYLIHPHVRLLLRRHVPELLSQDVKLQQRPFWSQANSPVVLVKGSVAQVSHLSDRANSTLLVV